MKFKCNTKDKFVKEKEEKVKKICFLFLYYMFRNNDKRKTVRKKSNITV